MAADPLRIVEAAYRWEPTDAAWLEGVVTASTGFGVGSGVVACLVQCTPRPHVTAVASADVAPADVDAVVRVCNAIDPAIARSFFAPTEFVGNASHRLVRLARVTGRPAAELTGGVPLPPVWALVAGAVHETALLLVFPSRLVELDPDVPFPGENPAVLGLVGAHLGSALRLRGLAPASADAPDTEAVLTPDGKVLHATGEATVPEARASLAEAVLRSERARHHVRKVAPAEATALWEALVDGNWSVLEATERDGKRFLLARRNSLRPPPLVPDTTPAPPAAATSEPPRRDLIDLTKEESDVVWLATHGHSHKYIAYELGVSPPTVARRLRSAMDKLRVGSRRELLRKLGVPER